MTDGYIAIMRHEAEEKGLSPTKGQEHKSLGLTAYIGDGLTLCQKVSCHPGHSGGDGHYVHDGGAAEQKVHRSVGPGVQLDEKDQQDIPHQGHRKESGNGNKEDSVQLTVVEKTEGYKICFNTSISWYLHGLDRNIKAENS